LRLKGRTGGQGDRKDKRDDQENASPAAHSESSFRHQIRTAPTGSEYQACHPNQTTATPREGGVLQITANAKENRNLHGRSSHLGGTMKITHEHVVSIPKSRVLEFYMDDDYYRGQLKNTGALTVEILETAAIPGGGKKRKAQVTAPSRVPQMLRTSDTDQYIDTNTVDVAGSRMFYEITPSMFADQFKLAGGIEFIDNGAGTRLVFSTEVEIRLPLIGKKLEKQAIDEAENEVGKQVEFLKSWAAK